MHPLHPQEALSWVSKDHSFLSAFHAFGTLEFSLHYTNVDITRSIEKESIIIMTFSNSEKVIFMEPLLDSSFY